MYKIESNVPMPNKYPFEDMNVGDSFYVQGDKKAITNVRVSANAYKKKTGCKFLTKTDLTGVRIWLKEKP
jgi:hypothetical protein